MFINARSAWSTNAIIVAMATRRASSVYTQDKHKVRVPLNTKTTLDRVISVYYS